MGRISEFNKVKLFCGLIFAEAAAAAAEKAKKELAAHFSPIDSQSALIPFTATDYYRAEMGEPLFRQFVSFSGLQDPERLPEIKFFTNRLEEKFLNAGKRTLNLDPGYLSDANVIIATSKNHFHRVPLRGGIYAHLEYVLKNKQFEFLPWTYSDFKQPEYLAFFRQLFILFRQNSHGRAK
ncbi:MAG: DUF4416 family protein [Candidatus Aminicenantes bacterium]|nr:DUF4416 family protein [Candidatus Aminicenantes bacterium]